MGKEISTLEDTEIEKNKFYHHGTSTFLKNVHIGKVLVSNSILCDAKIYKQFIDYLYNEHKVKPLLIMLPKTSIYVKRCNGQTK